MTFSCPRISARREISFSFYKKYGQTGVLGCADILFLAQPVQICTAVSWHSKCCCGSVSAPAGNKNWSILDSTLPGIVQQISAQLLWHQYDTAFPLIACNCSSKTGRFHRDIGKFTYPNSSRTNCLNRQVEPHIPIPSGCLQQAEVFGLAQLFFLSQKVCRCTLSGLTQQSPAPWKRKNWFSAISMELVLRTA